MQNATKVIAYTDGTDIASTSPQAAARAAGIEAPVEVLLGFAPPRRAWLDDADLCGRSVMAGYALTEPIASGRLTYVPLRLSAVPRFVHDVVRPDVLLASAVRRGDGFAWSENVGWGPAAVRSARAVVLEVAEGAVDLGAPMIECDPVAVLDVASPGPAPAFRDPDAVDRAIAQNVLRMLPHEPTIQLGPGGVPDAIVAALDRPVHVWSGVVTDSVGSLVERGLLLDEVTAAYTWGGAPLRSLAAGGRLRLVPVEESHDISRLSSIDRFVGLNTAIQLGLDGSVNVERVGGRVLAGIGGHPDFCAGASRSHGGVSIVALRSTAKGGASTIVPRVETVSTPHCDVEVVVTEHGIADLRGLDDPGRARAIIDVAAPDHRAALLAALG